MLYAHMKNYQSLMRVERVREYKKRRLTGRDK